MSFSGLQPVVTSSMMSLCLHPCIAVESHWVNTESLVAVCTAWYGVLNAALIYHSNIVYHMIPAYVGGVRRILFVLKEHPYELLFFVFVSKVL